MLPCLGPTGGLRIKVDSSSVMGLGLLTHPSLLRKLHIAVSIVHCSLDRWFKQMPACRRCHHSLPSSPWLRRSRFFNIHQHLEEGDSRGSKDNTGSHNVTLVVCAEQSQCPCCGHAWLPRRRPQPPLSGRTLDKSQETAIYGSPGRFV